MYFTKKEVTYVQSVFRWDVSCSEVLGIVQSQVVPWMVWIITRVLVKFYGNLTYWMC